MRLDEEKLEALRSWGERLGQASGEESAAVGRAILMLVEEIDRLHIELWHARLPSEGQTAGSQAASEHEEPVPSALHMRLRRVLRRSSEEPPGAEPAEARSGSVGDQTDAAAAQAWLESLRGQK
jgi:hypothetical protein